ncbi:Conjugal transfer protein [uncultured Desulfobacterium sp.]|uniref:Conjugal transfer protein n=1 Tax=uncultured Desulfobacterium sp. TaxID=201089 RepID=A0A445MSK2_9BACT|nr:Conjugal transfer protein [uncultured Desulfobacterium sp.]
MEAKTKKWKPSAPLSTPYQRAAQEWDNRMGNAVIQAKNWRLAFFSLLVFIVFPLIFGSMYLGAQPKAVPYVVDVEPDGSAIYRGPVAKLWENYRPEKTAIVYQLHRFLEDTRNVSSDMAVVKKNWFDAYKLVTPKSSSTLSAYANQNDPFARSLVQRVSIEITATVPLSADSWQVDWKETIWGPKGNVITTEYWRSNFKVCLVKPQSEDQLKKNPLGIYIDEFNWAKISR